MSNLQFLRKIKGSGSGTELLKNLDADPQPRKGFNMGGRHLPEGLMPPQPIVGFVLLALQLKKEHQLIYTIHELYNKTINELLDY